MDSFEEGGFTGRCRESVAASLTGAGVKVQDCSALSDVAQLFLGRWAFSNSAVCLFRWIAQLLVLLHACRTAYHIRGYSIRDYGMVIHEFDPWFNYRATEYLAQHGAHAFFKWFDYMSWYPLGRPVGTTIYPGMQFTSVGIWRALNWSGVPIPLLDVCVRVPQWFGVVATLLVAALTVECSGSANAGVAAAVIMSSVPAHLMRSVGGEYDNECVALSSMLLVFYLWCRSLRTPSSWPIGILAGLAYFNMVAAWGGYIFVLNMVGLHCAVLATMGVHNASLWKAYSSFYLVGTCLAMQIPVVGHAPIKSLEQLGPCVVAIFLQASQLAEEICRRLRLQGRHKQHFRYMILAFAALLLAAPATALALHGYFGPLSSRVRGLFVRHTHTGNPLVDSVAEHRPATFSAYWEYLHLAYPYAFLGLNFAVFDVRQLHRNAFLVLYWLVTHFFSLKMVRLILLAGPSSSALAGVGIGYLFDWSFSQLWWKKGADEEEPVEMDWKPLRLQFFQSLDKKLLALYYQSFYGKLRTCYTLVQLLRKDLVNLHLRTRQVCDGISVRKRAYTAIFFLWFVLFSGQREAFADHCEAMALALSEPDIIVKGTLPNGSEVLVDDYRQSYWWLRDNTPADARIMAWWDYGYQITGIANRTTIADGNTWNHEHIAMLGRCLTLPVAEAHDIIRHLADYVLIWAGGDDLAKSSHIRRIASSVYRDLCPGDIKCSDWFMDNKKMPSDKMRQSLLYHLDQHGLNTEIVLDPGLFKEVYTSVYRRVRIYQVMAIAQDSRAWVANPANRRCDAPGSWFCQGQYPPALDGLLEMRQAFAQLEDFNAHKSSDKPKQLHLASHLRQPNSSSNMRYTLRSPADTKNSASIPAIACSAYFLVLRLAMFSRM